MKEWLEEMTDKKEEEFRVQFKDSIQIMAGALKAGYSAENAIRETCHDLKPMYKSESRIIKEYEIMIRKLKIHIPVGQVLSEFAENVEQEDVDNFVTVFTTAQKSGDRRFGTLLSQNLRKGSKGLSELLKRETGEMFEERKKQARKLGEEAGTKLMIPLFMMLAVVFIIVIVPAFFTIQI